MTNIKHILNIAALAASLAVAPIALAQTRVSDSRGCRRCAGQRHRAKRRRCRQDRHRMPTTGSTSRRKPWTSRTSPNFLEAWARAHSIVRAGADKGISRRRRQRLDAADPDRQVGRRMEFRHQRRSGETRIRRIGRNELAAIQVALAYTDAQEEYKARDWNGDGVKEYATRGLATPGKQDGLYWASLPGEPESPLGAGFADAKPGQAVPRLSVQDPHRAGAGCAGRRQELCQERPHDRRLRAGGLAGEIR